MDEEPATPSATTSTSEAEKLPYRRLIRLTCTPRHKRGGKVGLGATYPPRMRAGEHARRISSAMANFSASLGGPRVRLGRSAPRSAGCGLAWAAPALGG